LLVDAAADKVNAGDAEHLHQEHAQPVADLRGIVNLTADTRFPVIFLDTHVQKYKELADRQSSVLPIYWGLFSGNV
jgi:hypothetical protein